MNTIRVVIVEDHALVRAGLRTSLQSAGIDVAGEATDGITAEALVSHERPDVVLLDLGLPGRDGIDVARALGRLDEPPRIVVLSMQEREEDVAAALAAGAHGYCVKSSDPATLIDAIRTVAAGGAYFDPRISATALARLSGDPLAAGRSPLTPRETEVLRLVADGIGNAEIGERLHIGLGTVKGHIADILEKLGAADRTQAAVIAYRRGFLR